MILTAKHANGSKDDVIEAWSMRDARSMMHGRMSSIYGDDVYIEYFEDRGLVWSRREDSIDDDGARAVASIHESGES